MSTVYLNGEYLPKSAAKVSVLDRGFLFGDGIYEVIPVYGGKPLRLAEHLQRLQDSLDGISLTNPYSKMHWSELINDVIARNEGTEQSLYLQVTRGAPSQRDHAFPQQVEHTVLLMSSPIAAIPAPENMQGTSALTLDDIRWQLCHLKTVALLGNVLLKQEALSRGYDECVLLRNGYATECSASNLFMVQGEVLVTPPKSNQLLPGITRDLIVEVALAHGVDVQERDIAEVELANADELWFSSSTKAIVPIVQLNDKPVGQGVAGSMWRRVRAYYCDYIEQLKRGEVS